MGVRRADDVAAAGKESCGLWAGAHSLTPSVWSSRLEELAEMAALLSSQTEYQGGSLLIVNQITPPCKQRLSAGRLEGRWGGWGEPGRHGSLAAGTAANDAL